MTSLTGNAKNSQPRYLMRRSQRRMKVCGNECCSTTRGGLISTTAETSTSSTVTSGSLHNRRKDTWHSCCLCWPSPSPLLLCPYPKHTSNCSLHNCPSLLFYLPLYLLCGQLVNLSKTANPTVNSFTSKSYFPCSSICTILNSVSNPRLPT